MDRQAGFVDGSGQIIVFPRDSVGVRPVIGIDIVYSDEEHVQRTESA